MTMVSRLSGRHASGHQQSSINLVRIRVHLFRERVQRLRPTSVVIQSILEACQKSDIYTAMGKILELWDQGYSAIDVVLTIFRVVKASDKMLEYSKLGLSRCVLQHLLV